MSGEIAGKLPTNEGTPVVVRDSFGELMALLQIIADELKQIRTHMSLVTETELSQDDCEK